MTQKISSVTPEQWAEVGALRDKIIGEQTLQTDIDSVRSAVAGMFADMSLTVPDVELVASPRAALQRAREIATSRQCSTPRPYHSTWLRSWSGLQRGAEIFGVKLDARKNKLFRDWADNCPVCFVFEDLVIVSQNPVKIHWDNRRLHNEHGPSVLWSDGWALWSIEGVAVTEQIVMRPQSITTDQILAEGNDERKRIMISRYGWAEFLSQIDAKPIDHRVNHVDLGEEALFACETLGVNVLVCTCPSKAKPFFMEVGEDVLTCEEAQHYLSNGKTARLLGSS